MTTVQNTMFPMIPGTYKGKRREIFISLWINHETFCDYFHFYFFFYIQWIFSLISAPVNCRCLNHVIFFLSIYSYDNSIGMRMKVVKIMELMVYDGYHNERRRSKVEGIKKNCSNIQPLQNASMWNTFLVLFSWRKSPSIKSNMNTKF